MADLVLAIDQGTTGSRVAVYDQRGSLRGYAYAEFTQHFPKPGWVEHDAAEIWDSIQRLIPAALTNARASATDIAAIGITNQRETVVLWDRATGHPVARAIVWQDRRTAATCAEFKARGLEPAVRAATGLTIDPYFSATKIAWLLDNTTPTSGLRARANKGELAAGTIESWLIYNLTGGSKAGRGGVHVTDLSNASRTLLMNIHTLDWDESLLREFNIPREILPEPRSCSEVYGHASAIPGLEEVPVCGAAGDQQAALFGQAAFEPGMAKNTYGTGSFVLLNTGEVPARTDRLLSTIAWQIGAQPVQYALEGSVFIAGAAVQWLRDGLGIITDAAETESLAASLDSNDDVYFVPALTGLGAPHWDPIARGVILGITRGTTRAHLCRAALEAMCYQARDVIDAMQQDSGVTLGALRADGGAATNSWLMQFQADIIGVPVEVPAQTQTTSLGAAYLAGLAAGVWRSQAELASHWKLGRRYEPSMTDDRRASLYAQWQRAVERARDWERPA
ncbi:MAG: glycerol kinase GlpK [Phycisphaerales bacterium]|nr:glycerol kinase GlpK [Phycisphaerales bacterium]